MAPYGVEMEDDDWKILRVVDSAQYGDVMGSLWHVGVIGSSRLKSLGGPDHTRYAKRLGGGMGNAESCRQLK